MKKLRKQDTLNRYIELRKIIFFDKLKYQDFKKFLKRLSNLKQILLKDYSKNEIEKKVEQTILNN